MGVAITTLIILILINAFFAAAELALVNLNKYKVKQKADKGDKRYVMIHHLISEPSRFLSTIQIGITLAGFLASAFAADFFAEPLARWLDSFNTVFSYSTLHTASLIIITIILSYFTLVFGELIPKKLALQQSEKFSLLIVRPLTVLFKLFYPLVKLLSFSTTFFVNLFGGHPNKESEEITEEEIRLMVNASSERGMIDYDEKIMINRIFEFNDKSVNHIFTHRTDMAALASEAGLEETIHFINQNPYSRIPVYKGSIDHIIGVIHVKDLFRYLGHDDQKDFNIKNIMRKPYFVVESRKIDELFASMKQKNIHIAIVLDEYGGTSGIVTIEDIIEEIVGDISSESIILKTQEDAIKQIDDSTYEVEGIINLYELEEELQLGLPVNEFGTLNAFLISQIGYIPKKGDHPEIDFNDAQFKVTEVGDYRIEAIRITINQKSSSSS